MRGGTKLNDLNMIVGVLFVFDFENWGARKRRLERKKRKSDNLTS